MIAKNKIKPQKKQSSERLPSQPSPLSARIISKKKCQINKKFKFPALISDSSKHPIREICDLVYPKRSIRCKGTGEQIKSLEKDFLYNFEILDTDKTKLLNYSRFSILLQSMYFIENPLKKTKEERQLTLKAWKTITYIDSKVVWKNNVFTLCVAIMNLYDKSLPNHTENVCLGRLINGIFCVRKEEIKQIHKTFLKFYENRRKTYLSISPENRISLRKNLSFEDKRLSTSPDRNTSGIILNATSLADGVKQVLEKSKLSRSKIHESILEEDNEILIPSNLNSNTSASWKSTSNEQISKDVKVIGIKIIESESLHSSICDSNSNFSSATPRVRLRLTTQVTPKTPRGAKSFHRKDSDVNRSMTVINKSESFIKIEKNEDLEDAEDKNKNCKEKVQEKIRMRMDEDKKTGKVIMSVMMPDGIREMTIFHKDEANSTFLDDLVFKYGLTGNHEIGFRKQFYNYLQRINK